MNHSITSRESQVLYLIAHENTATEIASILHLSPYTIVDHRKSLMKKLHARNTAGLVRRAFELGIMPLVNNIFSPQAAPQAVSAY